MTRDGNFDRLQTFSPFSPYTVLDPQFTRQMFAHLYNDNKRWDLNIIYPIAMDISRKISVKQKSDLFFISSIIFGMSANLIDIDQLSVEFHPNLLLVTRFVPLPKIFLRAAKR